MRTMKFLCILLGGLLLFACSSPGTGGANTARVVTGTITVPSTGDWSSLKLGVFSGGTLGAYPKLETNDNLLGVGKYRIIYSDLNDGSDVVVPPLSGTSYSIVSTLGTSSTYSFELPATIPQIQDPNFEYYYYGAWLDGTADGNLGLKDAFIAAVAQNGEFNRCATMDTTNLDDIATTITIDYFMQSRDLNGDATGNYKYVGHDDAAIPYNEQIELKDSSSGFNFDITATSGW